MQGSQAKRQAAARKAAATRRRNATQRRALESKTSRVATELERFQQGAGGLRSRAERVAERVKRLV
jgi:hypothetical protein